MLPNTRRNSNDSSNPALSTRHYAPYRHVTTDANHTRGSKEQTGLCDTLTPAHPRQRSWQLSWQLSWVRIDTRVGAVAIATSIATAACTRARSERVNGLAAAEHHARPERVDGRAWHRKPQHTSSKRSLQPSWVRSTALPGAVATATPAYNAVFNPGEVRKNKRPRGSRRGETGSARSHPEPQKERGQR